MMIIVPSAAAPIHKVNVSSCLLSTDCRLVVFASIPAILPTWASAPRAVTIIVPLPCVTGVFMNAMFFWSPAPISASGSVSASLDAGVLSPVKADSSMLSELDAMIRPSAATLSPAVINTTSPMTTSSTGIADSTPPRRTRAVCFVCDLSAFIALSALPSWRRPTTALSTVSRISTTPVLHSPIANDRIAAISRMICMYALYWSRKRLHPGTLASAGSALGPSLLQQLGGSRRAQAAVRVDPEAPGDLVGVQRVRLERLRWSHPLVAVIRGLRTSRGRGAAAYRVRRTRADWASWGA